MDRPLEPAVILSVDVASKTDSRTKGSLVEGIPAEAFAL